MDPASALIFAIIAARVVIGAWEAGRDQALIEARRARQALAADLRSRRQALAGRLETGLERGRMAGPARLGWWAWASVQAARALRRGMRGLRRGARDDGRAATSAAGPVRRILAAARDGARSAWRDAQGRRCGPGAAGSRIRLGVCERCGSVVASTALAWQPADGGSRWHMCPNCRAELGQPPPAARPDAATSPALQRATAPGPVPAPRGQAHQDVPATWPGDPGESSSLPGMAGGTARQDEAAPGGTPMANGTALAVPDGTATGESYTHAAWNIEAGQMHCALRTLGSALEQMLACLTARDAGRSQVAGVVAWADQVQAAMTHGESLIDAVNAAQRPVGEAIAAAGGPPEVAHKSYYAEI